MFIAGWAMMGTASAQAPPAPGPQTDAQRRSDELFQEGRKLLAAGDSAGACHKFDQAIALNPQAPGTMLNLGLCNQNLGKYTDALKWFRKAADRATVANLPDYENAARQRIAELSAKVARIRIAFASPPPPNAKVSIDGEQVADEDYSSVELDPGHHVLEAAAPGKKLVHQDFEVSGHGGQTLTITFVDGSNTIFVDRGRGRRHAGLIVGAAGIGLLAADGIVAWRAASLYHDNEACATDATMCKAGQTKSGALAATDRARTLASWGGDGLFIAGLAAVGIGGYLYFTAPKAERIDRVVWTPAVGPDHVGLAVSGAF